MADKTPKLQLIPDTAWGEFEGEARPCGLGFEEYSSVLAEVARNTEGPFTIGVFGQWGTGKTSLMKRVQRTLDADENVVTVWFNAWQFERDESPIVPLVATIVMELQRSQGKLKAAGRDLIKALRAVAYGFSWKLKAGLPGAQVEANFSAKEMIDRAGELSDPLLERASITMPSSCLARQPKA